MYWSESKITWTWILGFSSFCPIFSCIVCAFALVVFNFQVFFNRAQRFQLEMIFSFVDFSNISLRFFWSKNCYYCSRFKRKSVLHTNFCMNMKNRQRKRHKKSISMLFECNKRPILAAMVYVWKSTILYLLSAILCFLLMFVALSYTICSCLHLYFFDNF